VRDIDHVLAADTGKEVLGPATETDDLVRERRPEDEHLVVLGGRTVDQHVDVATERRMPALARDLLDAGARQLPEADQRVRLAPGVVVEPDVTVAPRSLLGRDAHES